MKLCSLFGKIAGKIISPAGLRCGSTYIRYAKSQSAMEYLMTYGWAILIIAVVLGALFGLGFFNAASLAPKVSAGSSSGEF